MTKEQEKEIKDGVIENEQDATPATENNAEQTETQSEEKAEKTVEEQLAEAQQQIDALKDQYLRAVAEFENYKKRTQKEKVELLLNGSEKAFVAILPIIDDMERALANAPADKENGVDNSGWELIYKKFMGVLEAQGVKKIETAEQDFNVDYHEAIAMVPGSDEQKGKVIDCVQSGYTLNDKVIRHAKVAVGQ